MTEQMNTIARTENFDVIIIGAGPGGEDSAAQLLAAGLSVALVETELVGGECFNWACVPSKAMLRPGHALRAARRLPGAAEAITGRLGATTALDHRDEIVRHRDDTSEIERFESLGATFFRGRGRLDGMRQVTVAMRNGEHKLTATHAVIVSTGSTAVIPQIPGLADANPWTNRQATSVSRAPRSLAVLGSGAVALEMAQAWMSLGSERVTVLSRRSSLLPEHEPFVGELVLKGLDNMGITVRFDTRVAEAAREPDGSLRLRFADGADFRADELLVATGKKAASTDIGLDIVGVPSGNFVAVNDDMTVGDQDWLYAIGDVNGRALLTHQASYHARIAASAIICRAQGRENDFYDEANIVAVPQVIFTDPEVATVGLTLKQAEGLGVRARRIEADMGSVLGARLHAHGYEGRASITVDDSNGTILGATFVGQDVADMVHAATIAVVGKVPVKRLRHAVPSFPTMSEIWLDLLADI
ncbi:dihydrolipoyl dehydrogenase family protein [Micromonospora chokoriensis]